VNTSCRKFDIRTIADVLFSENLVSDNEGRLEWKPSWDKERFLRSIDDEVDAVLELGKAKSSLIDSLSNLSKG
jgi:hypothetical protein